MPFLKPRISYGIVMILACFLFSASIAQAEDAPPPTTQAVNLIDGAGVSRTVPQNTVNLRANTNWTLSVPPKRIKVTYLGVETASADATLRAQLKLQEGFGLAVKQVYGQTPAEMGGIQQHDVLTKLNDQRLVNTEQLVALIRSYKPGDKVELTVIREAQEKKITATLIEKELEVFSGAGAPGTLTLTNSPIYNGRTTIDVNGSKFDVQSIDPNGATLDVNPR